MAGIAGAFTLTLLPRFEPAAVLDVTERDHVNFWIGVPTMYWTLLGHLQSTGRDPAAVRRHLRLCLSGGAPMPVELMKEFAETFGIQILEGYGLSETSPVATFNHADRPCRPGTVGEIKAFVVRKPGQPLTEPELVEWCRARFAAYKYPRLVEFRDRLPVSATGKVLKRELRRDPAEAGPPS